MWTSHRLRWSGLWPGLSFSDVRLPLARPTPQADEGLYEDGAARIGATLFGELLNATFASVGQHAVRKVARETFEHLLNLDLRFHLARQTGGLTRAIDRGTKCVHLLLSL